MSEQQNPCTECPGMSGGCSFDADRYVCVKTPEPLVTHLRKLLDRCKYLTVSEAYDLVEFFCGSNEVIWLIGRRVDGGVKSETQLKSYARSDDVVWCMANEVRFKFWGGPPNRLHYYNGSMETLLMDRVLEYACNWGIEATEDMFKGVRKKCIA